MVGDLKLVQASLKIAESKIEMLKEEVTKSRSLAGSFKKKLVISRKVKFIF